MIIETPRARAKMATAVMYVEYTLLRMPKKNREAVKNTNDVLLRKRLLLSIKQAYHEYRYF